jgi:hypothetical protein
MKVDLKIQQKERHDKTSIALERWANYHAKRISNTSFSPKTTRGSIRILGGDYFAHHQRPKSTNLRYSERGFAQTDAENMTDLDKPFMLCLTTINLSTLKR